MNRSSLSGYSACNSSYSVCDRKIFARIIFLAGIVYIFHRTAFDLADIHYLCLAERYVHNRHHGKEKDGKWFASASNRNKFLDPRELGDWMRHLKICLMLARAVRRMHMAGLSHSDLGYKNCLIAPTTTEERIQTIARVAGGFVYYVSLKGVTGAASLDTEEVSRKIELLRKHIDIPIGVGFGISNAESARKIGAVADAVIVGSRIVKEIENNAGREAEAVGVLVKELKDAIR